MKYTLRGIIVLSYLIPIACRAQDQPAVTDRLVHFPSAFFNKINAQTARLDAALTTKTQSYLQRLAKQEGKIRKGLYKRRTAADSATANRLFNGSAVDYTALAQKMQDQSGPPSAAGGAKPSGAYLPYLDSLKTSLKFLQQNPGLVQGQGGPASLAQINSSLAQVNQLEGKMQTATLVQQLVAQRKEQIRQALSQCTHIPPGLQSSFQDYSKQAYYYGVQVKAYKDELGDPDKLTKRALGLLGQLPAFRQFMSTHSELAGIFSLPGSGVEGGARALAGLQTRSGVQQLLQTQIAAGGPDAAGAVSQKMQAAQTELKNLKAKVTQAGGGSSSMDIPDFRPNGQHTRTFLRRVTYGFNMQSVRSTYYFPTTTDLGVSLGYKLNDKNTIGIGASYKMGWGQDIRHISVSSQGVGLRSFLDMKIKGSFFATGGFEYNYQQPVNAIGQLPSLDYWTKSGLVGVMKQYKIGGKMKGNVQLLWDFLSYSQVPRGQPILFRVGYAF